MKLVKPTAGFCVKVKTDDEKQRKVFINVWYVPMHMVHALLRSPSYEKRKHFSFVFSHSKEVQRASAKTVTQDGKRGQSWTLPHIVSPQRAERDAKGQPSETFDVCFHTVRRLHAFSLCAPF